MELKCSSGFVEDATILRQVEFVGVSRRLLRGNRNED